MKEQRNKAPPQSRTKTTTKIRAETSQSENKKINRKKVNEMRVFFTKLNKIDKSSARLTKKGESGLK